MTTTMTTATRFQQLIEKNQASRSSRRKVTNVVMLFVTGLMTLLALVPLFWIIGYVVYKGGQYINLDFFIHTPRPLGMAGGGVLNAIQGTLIIAGLATVIAIPPAVLAAFYAANNPNTPLGIALRFSTDVLSGVPSIVIGLFVYAMHGQTDGALLRLRRRCGDGDPDAADHHSHHGGDAQTGAAYPARGFPGTRRARMEDIPECRFSGGLNGIVTGFLLADCQSGR